MTQEEIAATLDWCFDELLDSTKRYPGELPTEIAPWYCYTRDGGHSIAVAVKDRYRQNIGPDQFLFPAPVKTVVRQGYELRDGYILCDLEYNENVGLIIPEGDDEW